MNSFTYLAIAENGHAVKGVIDAEDRRSALQQLSQRGLFPSSLTLSSRSTPGLPQVGPTTPAATPTLPSFGQSIKRKQITSFTREMSALLGASIPIPQALDSLGEEEENVLLKEVILGLATSVRKGIAFSAALDEHGRLFSHLYTSMVRVGEEAGVLPKVMNDLADLMEHEDEVRAEVMTAIAYPSFVLVFGFLTVTILMTVVLPRLFGMLQDMLPILPLPTLILLQISGFLHRFWLLLLLGLSGAAFGLRSYLKTPLGSNRFDRAKLQLPLIGPLIRSAALGRFARTLGTLLKSGVSLLPSLKIVENTIGNRLMAQQISLVTEETRGGDSLAVPLRKLGLFPRTVIQMIKVGEESGQLDEMLLKVAEIEERHMRARTKTLISLLAPAMILVVGALVGFIVIAILLPIFKMSRAIH